jgi:hypothetical protein
MAAGSPLITHKEVIKLGVDVLCDECAEACGLELVVSDFTWYVQRNGIMHDCHPSVYYPIQDKCKACGQTGNLMVELMCLRVAK